MTENGPYVPYTMSGVYQGNQSQCSEKYSSTFLSWYNLIELLAQKVREDYTLIQNVHMKAVEQLELCEGRTKGYTRERNGVSRIKAYTNSAYGNATEVAQSVYVKVVRCVQGRDKCCQK